MTKRVVFVVAHEGYHPLEYGIPKKMLQENGYTVITASNEPGFAIAKDGSSTKVDCLIEDLKPVDYDALYIIGGPGAEEALDNQIMYEVVQEANMAQKHLGAICYSPRILAKAGALITVTATGWNGDGALEEIFEEHGALYENVPCIIDHQTHIITAQGPKQAEEFARSIMEVL